MGLYKFLRAYINANRSIQTPIILYKRLCAYMRLYQHMSCCWLVKQSKVSFFSRFFLLLPFLYLVSFVLYYTISMLLFVFDLQFFLLIHVFPSSLVLSRSLPFYLYNQSLLWRHNIWKNNPLTLRKLFKGELTYICGEIKDDIINISFIRCLMKQ